MKLIIYKILYITLIIIFYNKLRNINDINSFVAKSSFEEHLPINQESIYIINLYNQLKFSQIVSRIIEYKILEALKIRRGFIFSTRRKRKKIELRNPRYEMRNQAVSKREGGRNPLPPKLIHQIPNDRDSSRVLAANSTSCRASPGTRECIGIQSHARSAKPTVSV